ncbi:MAG TPA: UDP-2,3-diacylglucosamine diphosphatase [Phycisphaerae bacterium]|nr:UDP-2,3-diacylglucosamine diphosphatase [Phycisphaerae bacterium]
MTLACPPLEAVPEEPDFTPPDAESSFDAVIISDIHLGAENCQAKACAAFLQSLLDGHIRARRLIINGDVFDSIDFRRLKKTHWKVLSQIRHLSDKLETVWIAGNHDGSADIVSHLLGVAVVEQYILRTAGRRLLIVHGHQFDRFIEDHPVLTRLADAGYWLLQKIDRTHYVARLAKRKSKVFVRCVERIRHGARHLAARNDCDGVICGHTHQPDAQEPTPHNPIAYYNSGCWTEHPSTYLTVHAGTVQLHRFTETPAYA